MSFFSRLFSRKGAAKPVPPAAPTEIKVTGKAHGAAASSRPAAAPAAAATPAPAEIPKAPNGAPLAEAVVGAPQTTELLRGIADRLQQDAERPDIWDMEADGTAERNATVAPSASAPTTAELLARAQGGSAAAAKARTARTKTRLIGFDTSDGDELDLMDGLDAPEAAAPAAPAAASAADMILFPVGWVLVTDGPGRGAHFALVQGTSSVGRGDDQTVRLDFGDAAISRSGHATISYDAETRAFTLGHGGKSNLIRLNGRPVIASETMENGDIIRMGETELRLVVLCNDDFDWDAAGDDEEGDDDLAIA